MRWITLFLLFATPPALAGRQPPPAVALSELALVPTPSGLQIADVVVGDGSPVQAGDGVDVEFALTLTDGTLVDATWLREGPFHFVAASKEVIPGFSGGVLGMRPGGRRVLVVPPELGYGDVARGPIPAGSTLLFDVVLVKGGSTRAPPEKPPEIKPGTLQLSPTGLQTADLVVGKGAVAVAGRTVRVEYTGWLRSTGERFDSSLSRRGPLEVRLGAGQVIKGWDEGLVGMKVGGKRVLVIPPELAYGDRAVGAMIPANSTLVFEVELVAVE